MYPLLTDQSPRKVSIAGFLRCFRWSILMVWFRYLGSAEPNYWAGNPLVSIYLPQMTQVSKLLRQKVPGSSLETMAQTHKSFAGR